MQFVDWTSDAVSLLVFYFQSSRLLQCTFSANPVEIFNDAGRTGDNYPQ